MHKVAGGKYRQLLKFEKLDACKIMENIANFPLLHAPLEFVKKTFPGLLQKCPYKVRCKKLSVSFDLTLTYFRKFRA